MDSLSLPKTERGYNHLLVIIDNCTGWVEIIPTKGNDAAIVAEAILSDRGTPFKNRLVKHLSSIMGVHHDFTAAYNPQANGFVERVHQSVIQLIKTYGNACNTDWDLWTAPIQFTLNPSVAAPTGESPFYLLYGRDTRLPLDLLLSVTMDDYPNLESSSALLLERMRHAFDLVRQQQQKMDEARRLRGRIGTPKTIPSGHDSGLFPWSSELKGHSRYGSPCPAPTEWYSAVAR